MAFVRSSRGLLASLGLALGFATTGCVDAPVTQDQLQEDGALRQTVLRAGGEQSAFSAVEQTPTLNRAAQISAVLAEVGQGPLSDKSRFEADVGTVHLHLRADGLTGNRPVVFRWTHEPTGEAVLVPGTLLPAETLRHVATHTIEPHQSGAWTVEVLSEAPGPDGLAGVLWQRTFEVAPPVEELPPGEDAGALPEESLP
ncbi:MAG: hypothetical protein AAF721_20150 [Myxococcota bacterium]